MRTNGQTRKPKRLVPKMALSLMLASSLAFYGVPALVYAESEPEQAAGEQVALQEEPAVEAANDTAAQSDELVENAETEEAVEPEVEAAGEAVEPEAEQEVVADEQAEPAAEPEAAEEVAAEEEAAVEEEAVTEEETVEEEAVAAESDEPSDEAAEVPTKAVPAKASAKAAPAQVEPQAVEDEEVMQATADEVSGPISAVFTFKYYAENGVAKTITTNKTITKNGSASVSGKTVSSAQKDYSTADGTKYVWTGWKDESGAAISFPLEVTYDEAAETVSDDGKAHFTFEATYEEHASVTVTLKFDGIRHANGIMTSTSTSNKLSWGGGWNITKKKFEQTTGVRAGDTFSYMGYEYTYTGLWQNESGDIIDATATFSMKNGNGTSSGNTFYFTEDASMTFTPIYEQVKVNGLDYYYIDNISTGSGSWSNKDAFEYRSKFGSLTHTFKNPEDASPTLTPHDEFINWVDYDNNKSYNAGDSFTYVVYANTGDRTFKIYAVWQPSVTVNYYDYDGTLLESVERFEDIKVYEAYAAPEIEGAKFEGWYTKPAASGDMEGAAEDDMMRLPEDAIYYKPEPTYLAHERTEYDVYARYTTSYTIEHYQEQLDGTFKVVAADIKEVADQILGDTVSAEPNEYTGFTFDETIEGTLTEAELQVGTVLKFFYTRDAYTVTYEYTGDLVPEGADEQLPEAAEYKYEEEVPAGAVPAVTGYTFSGWTGEVEIMPAENVTVTGSWTANAHIVTVNYVDESGNTLAESQTVEYLYGAAYDVSEYDAIAIEGYEYVETDAEVAGTMGDEDLVINVVYAKAADPEPQSDDEPAVDPDPQSGDDPTADPDNGKKDETPAADEPATEEVKDDPTPTAAPKATMVQTSDNIPVVVLEIVALTSIALALFSGAMSLRRRNRD